MMYIILDYFLILIEDFNIFLKINRIVSIEVINNGEKFNYVINN